MVLIICMCPGSGIYLIDIESVSHSEMPVDVNAVSCRKCRSYHIFTLDVIIVFDAVHEAEFDEDLFKSLLSHGLRDDKLCVVLDRPCKVPVFLRLRVLGVMVDHGLLLDLGPLNLVVTGNEVD